MRQIAHFFIYKTRKIVASQKCGRKVTDTKVIWRKNKNTFKFNNYWCSFRNASSQIMINEFVSRLFCFRLKCLFANALSFFRMIHKVLNCPRAFCQSVQNRNIFFSNLFLKVSTFQLFVLIGILIILTFHWLNKLFYGSQKK